MATRKLPTRTPQDSAGPLGPLGPQNTPGQDQFPTVPDKTKPKPDKSKGPKKPPPKKNPVDVAQAVKKYFPQYSYILENPDVFGRDLVGILTKAAQSEGKWTSERVLSAIQRTKYWQTTVQAAKNFDAMPEADRLTLVDQTKQELSAFTDITSIDEGNLTNFARDMARRGIKGDALRPLAYKFAFEQGADAKAAQEALVSQTAQNIRQVASQYGQMVDDDTIQSLLEKGETAETMQRKYVAKLKAQYPQLSAQLDAGLTFSDITNDYKRVAATVLEKPADSVDFMDPKYMEAIAEPDGKGGYRQLSLGEWQRKLRTDDRYGYSKTTQAIQDARALADSIARSFGKVI